MNFIKSPLNYIGGKYKILEQIYEVLPEEVDTFVDLFAGGFNVGINSNAKKIICNDQITYLIDLFQYLAQNNINDIISNINKIINEFSLSQQNTEGYNLLRNRYNETKDIKDFFVLIFFSFNHQIRFNSKLKFNVSFGKNRSSYNATIEKNLIRFCDALQNKNIEFFNKDFLEVDLYNLGNNDLVYCDPPYLISTAPYNDGKNGFKNWTQKEEEQLLNLLDNLNSKGIRFALSNVLYHKGCSNDLLIDWSKKYNINYIDKTYKYCNYQFKEKDAKTVEVVITNFS